MFTIQSKPVMTDTEVGGGEVGVRWGGGVIESVRIDGVSVLSENLETV